MQNVQVGRLELSGMARENFTVLASALAVLRRQKLTTIFGNPGSNELPFLAGLDADFDYVLGLHEQVVVGMAEGYARATGRAAFVNLHAASGTGNAMGALTNAYYGHIPLVILAGQQVRRTVGQETMLASKDAASLPVPLVKHSHEPLAAVDVPRSLTQAIFEATTTPKGPTYVSVPLDDWSEIALEDDVLLLSRTVSNSGGLSVELLDTLLSAIESAKSPALVLGPQIDATAVTNAEVFENVVVLAEKMNAQVYIAPSPSRCPFPTTHPNFEGVLTPGIASVSRRLSSHDLVLVLGAPVFRYHRWEPGRYLESDTRVLQLTEDPREATRAPFGETIIVDLPSSVEILAEQVRDRGLRQGERGSRTFPAAEHSRNGMTGTEILTVLNNFVDDDVVYVNETTTLDLDYLERVAIDRPGMYHFPASGGLGFGLPVAVGLAIGDESKTVIATVGDGSANYGISALYTAAQRKTRTIFVIVNNSEYGALAAFAERMNLSNVDGLQISGIDFTAIAEGYGVPAQKVTTLEGFQRVFAEALQHSGPYLIDAVVVSA
jgi:benzoylformate decarboxylase